MKVQRQPQACGDGKASLGARMKLYVVVLHAK